MDATRELRTTGAIALSIATMLAMLSLPAGATAATGPGIITTVAPASGLHNPAGVVAAPGGGYYVADSSNNVVDKVGADGTAHRVAGTGTSGLSGDGGPAVDARLNFPRGLAVESDGSLLIADKGNSRIRRVDPDGTITTFAGTSSGFGGDGLPATTAKLCSPGDVAVAIDDSVLIADSCNARIRRVDPNGDISTIVGSGTVGYSGDGGQATSAALNDPEGIASMPDGGYVIADSQNNAIRRVRLGNITTVAGNHVAGGGGDGGPATAAQLKTPQGVDAAGDGTL